MYELLPDHSVKFGDCHVKVMSMFFVISKRTGITECPD